MTNELDTPPLMTCPGCGAYSDHVKTNDAGIVLRRFPCGAEWSNETGRAQWIGTCYNAMAALERMAPVVYAAVKFRQSVAEALVSRETVDGVSLEDAVDAYLSMLEFVK